MIQFRWRLAKTQSYAQDQGDGTSAVVTQPLDLGAVKVDDVWCVLQYKLHFVPTTKDTLEFGGKITTLKEGRECDTQWQDVTIQLPALP